MIQYEHPADYLARIELERRLVERRNRALQQLRQGRDATGEQASDPERVVLRQGRVQAPPASRCGEPAVSAR